PNTKKPQNGYPVLIINHGYINTKLYDIINSYKTITDYFSSKGYLVLKPDYRGNGNSEIDNEALMRFSYPIDVLNLISSVENIEDADKNSIFLWGHSMGAEVTLKVLEIASQDKTLNGKIKAAVLWAPVADTVRWFEKNHVLTLPEANLIPFPYEKTFEILGTPEKNPVLWNSLSPLSYLSDINIPVQINHGTDDQTVPYSWSIELYDDFLSLNKKTTLNLYPDDNHNLSNSFNEVTQNNLNFFNNYK
ncbi:MAG: alpha/beta fold hydrolase, partial [Candidatus Levybacteria bacterium]|nr:alpha/beta fold hydrolase [Candidatus Levybacteria bacterium]